MYECDLELAIFDGPPNVPVPPLDVAIFRECLETLVRVDRLHLRADRTIPPLYELARRGLIRYRDPENVDDKWCDVVRAIKHRDVDCEDLACWRVAELNEQGVGARVAFSIRPHPNGRRRAVHIYVRLPDGRTEDTPQVVLDIERAMR